MSTETGETAKLIQKGNILEKVLRLPFVPKTIREKINEFVENELASMQGKEAIPYELGPDQPYIRPCHWCDGIMRDTPTAGRLECQTCGAVSLCGRQLSFDHVKRADTARKL